MGDIVTLIYVVLSVIVFGMMLPGILLFFGLESLLVFLLPAIIIGLLFGIHHKLNQLLPEEKIIENDEDLRASDEEIERELNNE